LQPLLEPDGREGRVGLHGVAGAVPPDCMLAEDVRMVDPLTGFHKFKGNLGISNFALNVLSTLLRIGLSRDSFFANAVVEAGIAVTVQGHGGTTRPIVQLSVIVVAQNNSLLQAFATAAVAGGHSIRDANDFHGFEAGWRLSRRSPVL